MHWLDLILEATDSPVIVTIETVWGALELPEFEVVLTKLRTKYVPTVTILNSSHLGGYTNGARVLIVAPSTAAVALMNGGVDMSFDVVPCHAVRECFDLSLSRPAFSRSGRCTVLLSGCFLSGTGRSVEKLVSRHKYSSEV